MQDPLPERFYQATYAKGYEGYQVAASYDTENWFRVPTTFDGQVMTVSHTPELDSIYYAYFEPYSWERHLRLLGEVADNPIARARHRQLGRRARHESGRGRQSGR